MNNDNESFDMYKDIKTLLPKVIENLEAKFKTDFNDETQYVATGFKDIYFKKGNLIILASHTCIGKTTMSLT